MTRFTCKNCGYRFELPVEKPKRCPYCAEKRVEKEKDASELLGELGVKSVEKESKEGNNKKQE